MGKQNAAVLEGTIFPKQFKLMMEDETDAIITVSVAPI